MRATLGVVMSTPAAGGTSAEPSIAHPFPAELSAIIAIVRHFTARPPISSGVAGRPGRPGTGARQW
ncbi:hypothetical protein GCM10009527_060830 [Actinomadura nitritigenes]